MKFSKIAALSLLSVSLFAGASASAAVFIPAAMQIAQTSTQVSITTTAKTANSQVQFNLTCPLAGSIKPTSGSTTPAASTPVNNTALISVFTALRSTIQGNLANLMMQGNTILGQLNSTSPIQLSNLISFPLLSVNAVPSDQVCALISGLAQQGFSLNGSANITATGLVTWTQTSSGTFQA